MTVIPTDENQGLIFRYIAAHSSSLPRYIAEELLDILAGWLPTPIGIGVRSIVWSPLMSGALGAGIERGVILKHTGNIELGRSVYLDRRVYLHGGIGGLSIGDATRVMYGAELNVYNFRGLESAGIHIGSRCVIGPSTIITGQGGVNIGDNVIIGPGVKILPVNHEFTDTEVLIREQELSAKGINIEDNVWIGGGAIVLDGVNIGTGSVVGAGSVVTQDILAGSVVVGNPARIVKSREHQASARG